MILDLTIKPDGTLNIKTETLVALHMQFPTSSWTEMVCKIQASHLGMTMYYICCQNQGPLFMLKIFRERTENHLIF